MFCFNVGNICFLSVLWLVYLISRLGWVFVDRCVVICVFGVNGVMVLCVLFIVCLGMIMVLKYIFGLFLSSFSMFCLIVLYLIIDICSMFGFLNWFSCVFMLLLLYVWWFVCFGYFWFVD